jgi:putative redox protein
MAARSEKITFANAAGEQLGARLDWPADPPGAFALFAHCFTCSKDSHAAARISRGLAARGVAVLRFDFTGLGSREGEFANTDFSSNLEDLAAAADYLRQAHRAPKILIGHSLGGAAVLAAADRIPEAVAVATIAAPFDPAHVAHLLAPARAQIEARGEAEVTIGGRGFRVRKQFLDDIGAHKLSDHIARLQKALIVFHAPRDEIVGIENASHIFTAARHPKSFVSLDDADHLLTRRADATYVADVLAAWVSRYLPEAEAPAVEAEPRPGQVVVAETGDGKFTQIVRVGRHRLRADEPTSMPGGLDTGPSPYDYLLAGLGACTSMTLRLYAERKQLPLERVLVHLKREKIHANDCADCETREGMLDQIERTLELTGALAASQRQRLLEIADKCPVHRTLTSEVKIRTRLAG